MIAPALAGAAHVPIAAGDRGDGWRRGAIGVQWVALAAFVDAALLLHCAAWADPTVQHPRQWRQPLGVSVAVRC